MYQLHIANKNYSSWSLRPWVLMRELKIPFEEKLHPFLPGSNWSEFRAFSPTGRVPALHDGATVIWDSLGIALYLADRHDGVWPKDRAARAFAQCAAAEMHSGFQALRQNCSMSVGIRVKLKAMPDELKGDIARLTELWSEGLSRFGGPFLGGAAFTAADAFFAPIAFRVQTYGLPFEGAPGAYGQRLLAVPAMREWQDGALAETVREEEHEEYVLKYGAVTEDLRAKS